MKLTDNELIELVTQKNQQAFDELTKRYIKLIKSIVIYHLKDLSMWQDDCVNDILFAIWQNADKFDAGRNSLKNWIGAVSKYRCINYKRKFYRDLTAGELNEEITDGKDINTELLASEINEEIMSLLSALKPVDKEIFIKHYFKDVPINEISIEMNKNADWIYNRISRGKKKLRKMKGLKPDEK